MAMWEEKMFCSGCGKEIVNGAKVCRYCGKPVQGSRQQNNGMQQQYNNPSNNNHDRNVTFKPDNKFNIWAGFFTGIWSLIKGMWDLFFIYMLVHIICALLVPLGIGSFLWSIFLVVKFIFVGRNANYYYRLKETQKIPMYKAIRDPNLRSI